MAPKIRRAIRHLLLLLLLFLSPCGASSRASSYQTQHANSELHLLHQLLTPSSIQKDHENAMNLLSTINIPPSCLYSSLTKEILAKCSTSHTILDGEDKIFFATKLAVCEFKSANVDYPKDCRFADSPKDTKRCVQRLRSEPQWWTSYSNCLQSVSVLCQAVRDEAEKQNLLQLYRDLAGLQHQLQERLFSSLDWAEVQSERAENFADAIKLKYLEVLRNFDVRASESLDPVSQKLEILHGIAETLSRTMKTQGSILEGQLSSVEDSISKISQMVKLQEQSAIERHKRDDDSSVVLLEKHKTIENYLNPIMEMMESMKNGIDEVDSIVASTKNAASQSNKLLENFTDDFNSLSMNADKMSDVMKQHEDYATQQSRFLASFTELLNTTVQSFVIESNNILHRLQEAQQSQSNQTFTRISDMVTPYLPILVSVFVLLGRKRSAMMVLAAAVAYALCTLCNPYSELPHDSESMPTPENSTLATISSPSQNISSSQFSFLMDKIHQSFRQFTHSLEMYYHEKVQ